jgi:hypothetical protein
MAPDMDDAADLNEQGKRSAPLDEVQEVLDMTAEQQGPGEATALRLCRYSKQEVHILPSRYMAQLFVKWF